MGVLERTRRPRLTLESSQLLRLPNQPRREELDRHRAADTLVASPPNLPHAPFPEGATELVRAEAESCCEVQGRYRLSPFGRYAGTSRGRTPNPDTVGPHPNPSPRERGFRSCFPAVG